MKKLILAALLPLLCGLWACRKDENCPPDLPCATQSGENTFGCYINGVPWVAEVAPYVLAPWVHPIEAEYDEPGYGQDYMNQFRISASHYDSVLNGFMTLYIRPIKNTGFIGGDLAVFSATANIGEVNPSKLLWAFDSDSIMNYQVEITKCDIEKNIISGEFYFDILSNSDTIKITNGRFDVKYSPY
jgi:hypothetical protein